MRITRDNGQIILRVNQAECDTIFYVLGFCLGGVSDEHELQASKMIGVYESFQESETEAN